MHHFLLAIALGSLQTAQLATPPAPGSDWQRVQGLAVGTSIQVATKTGHGNCRFKNVDADTLTCTRKKDVVFQRADIVTVKVPRRGRSALVGMGIGAGAAAVAGAATASCTAGHGCFIPRPTAAVIFAIPGAGIGALIGALTNSAKSTIYNAP